MYGNTHVVAGAVGDGLERLGDVSVVAVEEASAAMLAGADLVVVGAPTHVHGLSRPSTRRAAADDRSTGRSTLVLDPAAGGPGVREWLAALGASDAHAAAAAFDTRLAGPPLLTGRASKQIAKQLRAHGYRLVAEPESFLVSKDTRLLDGEVGRAEEWGRRLAEAVTRDA
jgi:hypothetical protein